MDQERKQIPIITLVEAKDRVRQIMERQEPGKPVDPDVVQLIAELLTELVNAKALKRDERSS